MENKKVSAEEPQNAILSMVRHVDLVDLNVTMPISLT
jgi:hypothetical protein